MSRKITNREVSVREAEERVELRSTREVSGNDAQAQAVGDGIHDQHGASPLEASGMQLQQTRIL